MKRYDLECGYGGGDRLVASVDGAWIRYDDHVEAMKRIAGEGRVEPVAWLIEEGAEKHWYYTPQPKGRPVYFGHTPSASLSYEPKLVQRVLDDLERKGLNAATCKFCRNVENVGQLPPPQYQAGWDDAMSEKSASPAALTETVDSVWQKLDDYAQRRTSPENVADVLNALAASPADQALDFTPGAQQAQPVAWYRDEQVDTNEDSQGLPPNYITYRKVHAYPQRPTGEGWKPLCAPAPIAAPAALTDAVDRTIQTIERQLELIAERAPGAYLDKRPVVQSLTAHVRRLRAALLAASPADQVGAEDMGVILYDDVRDAARYRFIKESRLILSGGTTKFGWAISPFGEQCDRYIDAAMSASKEGA